MATYLYGLLLARNAHCVPPHITGIDGGSVRVLDAGELGAIVSTLDRTLDRAGVTLDAVRAHDRALQAVVHHGATAAATRFGQTFDSDAACVSEIRASGASVAAILAECDGCVEMRLLMNATGEAPMPDEAAPDGAAPGAVGEGRAYLESLRRGHDRARHLSLRAALGPVVRRERVDALSRGPERTGGIAFSHLIERGREAEYRASVEALPALADGTIVGPLALYSFLDDATA